MGKRREDKRETRKQLTKIKFLVEGPTEKNYFKDLLKDINYKLHIDIEDVGGGGYSSFTNKININKVIYDIIIVIADLDRVSNHKNEKGNLKTLIKLIEKENKKNNIFLTFRNIETWIEATFDYRVSNLTSELGYTGSSKGKNDIYKRLKDKNARFENGISKFKKKDLYYYKPSLDKGVTQEVNIYKVQSNLMYFIDYLNDILKVLNN